MTRTLEIGMCRPWAVTSRTPNGTCVDVQIVTPAASLRRGRHNAVGLDRRALNGRDVEGIFDDLVRFVEPFVGVALLDHPLPAEVVIRHHLVRIGGRRDDLVGWILLVEHRGAWVHCLFGRDHGGKLFIFDLDQLDGPLGRFQVFRRRPPPHNIADIPDLLFREQPLVHHDFGRPGYPERLRG